MKPVDGLGPLQNQADVASDGEQREKPILSWFSER